MNNNISTRDLAKMSMCMAIICVSAYITFPIPFSPVYITAATATLCLTALLLPPKQTFLVILSYLILGGVAGMPVLPGGIGGLERILGPYGGYYYGWLIAFPLISVFKGTSINLKRYIFVSILISIPITYLLGVGMMMLYLDINIEMAILQGVLPFIVGDVLKCVLASALGTRLNRYLNSI